MKGPSPRSISFLALLGAAAFGLWLWLGPWAGGEWSDGQRAVAADTTLRVATWGEPQAAWPGLPAQADSRATLSSDGKWLVWAAQDSTGGHDLFAAELHAGRVSEFAPIAALCSAADECAPAFGVEWLYFSSDRPGGAGGHDLWRARFANGVAEAPELVPGPANTAADEFDPAPRGDGGAIVFVADRDHAGWDLYTAPLGDGAASRLDELCSAGDEREPAFTQQDRALVFASSRSGGRGGFDLYRSARFGDRYAAAHPLAELNSSEEERAPIAATDELGLCFLRTEAGANPIFLNSPAVEVFRAPRRDIHWTEWLALAGLLALALLALLVRRFPELDGIYKCLLASVILHLLLLWWFHDVWLAIGKSEPEPSRAPLQVRLEHPTPRVAPASTVAAPSTAEPQPAPALEPTPPIAMTLPAPVSEPPASGAPERFEFQPESSEPTPAEGSVASAALEASPPAARELRELEPLSASERAVAIREPDSTPRAAKPAPALDLDPGSIGAPSATSRALGQPSRPEHQRSLGSPAAGPTSGSVARSAPEPYLEIAASSSAAGAEPGAGKSASAALELRDGASAGSDHAARSAAPAAALALGDLAARESQQSDARTSEESLQRATVAPDRRASASTAAPRSESVAQRAAEALPDHGLSVPRRDLSPAAPSRSQGADVVALEAPSAGQVAVHAAEAPALGLDALERAPGAAPRSSPNPNQGPQRASTASGAARPTAAANAGESLATRGAAPAVSLARAPDGLASGAPVRADREQPLADAGESVARPAAPSNSAAGSDLLSGLGAPAQADAGSQARSPSGPERAEGPSGQNRAAQPLAANAPSLARAPQPPADSEPRPAKSDWDSTPYKNRSGAEKARALKLYGGSERTEAAVARGLEYLARIQHSNGAWGELDAVDEKYGRVAIGKTALCTLAFLGAGHTPQSATQHSDVVARALEFLLSVQDADSGHFGESSAYDHGIATYAIAECFALTHDARLRTALEPALAHVLAMQSRRDDERLRGGWGYYFADGSLYDPWSRTSITAWQVMALESARLSGLNVPDRAFDEARTFLDKAADPELGAYRYNHDPERLRSAYPTLPASTPAALFALALLGEDIADQQHATARAYVLERAPDGYRYNGENDFVHRGRGNPYFWYYGTLAMFRLGGESWQRWNAALQESLLPAQARDGSWLPQDVYARYARDDESDKSYTTSLCVLSLEVYYRYYLPLLKVR